MAFVLKEGEQGIPIQCDRQCDGSVFGARGELEKGAKPSIGVVVDVNWLHFLQEIIVKFGLKNDKDYGR